MRRITIASVLVCALSGAFAQPVAAQGPVQIGCASIETPNSSYQQGFYNLLVSSTVETKTFLNPCTSAMVATVYVEGVGGAITRWGFIAATASKVTEVTQASRWYTKGIHGVTIMFVPVWIFSAGETTSYADVVQREEPPPYEGGPESCSSEESWDEFEQRCIPLYCPIVISMDGEGYRFTSARRGVPFDLDVTGGLERVAWTTQDSEQAFLALDRNGNGRIDSGAELFGNRTPVIPGTSATAPNGFEALRFAQAGTAFAADDVVNANDPVWSKLLLWTDRNHNGLSEPSELKRVCETDIVAIGLNYRESRRVDRFGNELRQRGTIQRANGRTEAIFDVWLTRR